MGILDTLLGNTSANAANAAAADTYKKQQAATTNLSNFGDQYAQNYGQLAKGYDPYVQTGYTANSQLDNLLKDPSSIRSLPGYQFQVDEGTRALDHSAAAGSGIFNGAAGKALQAYGQNVADTTYGNQLQRLSGLSGQGQQALGQQNATIGQGLQGQLSTRQSAYGGDMQSAGTIGQGQIAGANAQTQGIQNLLGSATYLGGAALGGGFSPSKFFANPVSNAAGGYQR